MISIFHWLIRFYQVVISPLLGPRCRYFPTCSQYALDAVHIHGVVKGSCLAIKRVCRCHPFGGFGFDPVPIKTIRFISFHKIDSQMIQISVPFRGHVFKNHSNH